jgi:hypothetical protein
MYAAAAVLVLAALGGIVMAAMILRGRERPPIAIALIHGAAAATGVALLASAVLGSGTGGLARYAFYVFLVAIAGGATMFLGFHLRKKPIPKAFVLIHGSAAAVGLALLIAALLGV